MFNSYNYRGSQVRLKLTNSFSTVGCSPLTIGFAWFQSTVTSYPTNEGVTVQWSTDGMSWNNGGFYQRYSSVSNGWRQMQEPLPDTALNQASVYIAFPVHIAIWQQLLFGCCPSDQHSGGSRTC